MRLLSLSTDEGQVRLHAERVIANARAALSAGGLIAVYLDPAEPSHFAPVAYSALSLYVLASVAILVILRRRTTLQRPDAAMLYGLDLVVPAVLTTFTEGAGSPLFVFVWFAMIAAAFRSGLRGTFATGGLMLAVLVGQALFFSTVYSTVSLNLIIVRATLLAVMAFLLGYLAEKERDLRLEAVAIARVLARSRSERTFTGALEGAVDEIAKLYASPGAVLAITDAGGDRHCWRFRRNAAGTLTGELTVVTAREEAAYFFEFPPDIHSWFCRRDRVTRHVVEFVAVGPEGARSRARLDPPPQFWDALGSDTALGAVESFGDSVARLFLPAPAATLNPQLRVHLLHVIASQAAPPLMNMYLQRAQAGTTERARLARELHDRVVQSLIGLEMQMSAFERPLRAEDPLRNSLESLRRMLRSEIDNVRDLMHELRPLRVSPEDLVLYLSDTVERFQRQTGIHATLVLLCQFLNSTSLSLSIHFK